ncbi:MAG: hypothetical protein AAGK97_18505, partial [Bacteroidota bacterium]
MAKGYYVESISKNEVRKIINYVENQEVKHYNPIWEIEAKINAGVLDASEVDFERAIKDFNE